MGTATAVEVVVDGDDVDLASGLLWAAGVTAVAEHPRADGSVCLRADVPPGGFDAVRAAVGDRWTPELVDITDDGLSAWRDHATLAPAGRRLVVRPPWVPLVGVDPGALVVEVDPGDAFGHGAHPTTRLCLAALEAACDARPGSSVLDVGCGSGVLSIAAALLGAGRVVACDVAPEAVEATRANAARNGVGAQIDVRLVDPVPPLDALGVGDGGDGRFDLVVANIGADALVALAPVLLAALATDGRIVVSGLLDPPRPDVAEAFVPLVVEVDARHDGWTALTLVRPGGRVDP
jgi:ribosomal protein L11 methyltransferase